MPHLRVRRLFCRDERCTRTTFVEQVAELTTKHGRRSIGLSCCAPPRYDACLAAQHRDQARHRQVGKIRPGSWPTANTDTPAAPPSSSLPQPGPCRP